MHVKFSQESILQVNKLLKYSQVSEQLQRTPQNSRVYGRSAPNSPNHGAWPPPPPTTANVNFNNSKNIHNLL